MNKRILITSLLIVSFIILCCLVKELLYKESKERIADSWRVEKIVIDGKDLTDLFKLRSVTFIDDEEDNFVLVPYKISESMGADKNANWSYDRNGVFNGIVRIFDTQQGIFDGTYEIEILDNERPCIMRLYSKKIEMICIEKYMSIEKPFINR